MEAYLDHKSGRLCESLKQGLLTESLVVDGFRTRDDRSWVEVRVDGAHNKGTGRWGTPGVICTSDHIWYLSQDRRQRADQLLVGDRVVLPKLGPDDLILGTLMGDGYVSGSGVLRIAHTNKEWATVKATALGTKLRHGHMSNGYKRGGEFWYVQTHVAKKWRTITYEGKQKLFSRMSDRALAVFYGDDGCLASKRKKNQTARLCLHAFAENAKPVIKAWFELEFGNCSIQNGGTLALSVAASKIFFERIAPYLHTSVAYKLPEQYQQQYNGWMERGEPQLGWVENVLPAYPKQYSQQDKFCISVQDTHCFFTRAGLVSNCWLFDDKVLKAVGKRDFGDGSYLTPRVIGHDTLQMFHYWQPDLPAHLQFTSSFAQYPIAWKHLAGTNIEFYGCFDVDATQHTYRTMRKTMADRQMWDDPVVGRTAAGYVNQVEHLRPILAAMEDRGLPVDDERRLALGAEFDAAYSETVKGLDARFPAEARKITPPGGYKGMPPRVEQLLEKIKPTAIPEVVAAPGKKVTKKAQAEAAKLAYAGRYGNVTAEEMAIINATIFEDPPVKDDEGIEWPGEKFYFDLRPFGQLVVDETLNARTQGEWRWCRMYEFSPGSPMQMKNYIRVRGHKMPTKKGGGETTEKKELERLAAKHGDDFYLKVIECRELNKARSTYIDGYKPHADGRVHTTFTFDTGTGQLSSRNPNIQNTPKHSRLAKAVRSMIRHPEKLLVEWDFKAYHVLTTGYCARDKDYMRFARLDMHSFVAGHFNKDWDAFKLFHASDGELMERFTWFKSDPKRKIIRDKKAKPTILGVGFGLGDRKLYEMNLEAFASLKEAMMFKRILRELFPRVFVWQGEVRDLAHQQGFLRNEFGAIRWFYEVYKPNGKGGWTGGEQSEEAIAFLPASLAFGNIRECMKEIDRRGLAEKWSQDNTVHDSLLYEVYPRDLEEHCHDLYPVLTAPSKVLRDVVLAPGGLIVDCECSAGLDWGVLKGIELPTSMQAYA